MRAPLGHYRRRRQAGSWRSFGPVSAGSGLRPGNCVRFKTTAKVAAELRRTGIRVSPNTVARLLKTLDYRLRSNEKKIARCSPADRDDQFRKIAALRKAFEADGLPIISIDTKKKEQVGLFRKHPAPNTHGDAVALGVCAQPRSGRRWLELGESRLGTVRS